MCRGDQSERSVGASESEMDVMWTGRETKNKINKIYLP